jgi:quaternary ammonium compound-resistance protein SugE
MIQNVFGPWVMIVTAGLLEVAWALGFKYAWDKGWGWRAGCIAALGVSMWLLVGALKHLPAGTAYAVWTGIGAVGVAIIGIVFFAESAQPLRLFFIALIVTGVVGLSFAGR